MLTGADLLNRVKELGDCAKTDLARGCGYVVTKKDGSEQVKFTDFYLALLEAKGVSVGGLVQELVKPDASCPLRQPFRETATC